MSKSAQNLTQQQKETLQKFILEFLPKTGNMRKTTGNEIEKISSTLDRLFKQSFGFNLSQKNVLDAFKELNYRIFTKNGELDFEAKEIKPSNNGHLLNRFIYIEIQALMMQNLRLPFFGIHQPNIKKEKIELAQYYIEKIESFKKQFRSAKFSSSLLFFHQQTFNRIAFHVSYLPPP